MKNPNSTVYYRGSRRNSTIFNGYVRLLHVAHEPPAPSPFSSSSNILDNIILVSPTLSDTLNFLSHHVSVSSPISSFSIIPSPLCLLYISYQPPSSLDCFISISLDFLLSSVHYSLVFLLDLPFPSCSSFSILRPLRGTELEKRQLPGLWMDREKGRKGEGKRGRGGEGRA